MGAWAPPCLLPETRALQCRGRGCVASREAEKPHHPVAFDCLATCVSVGSQKKSHFSISVLLFFSLLWTPDICSLSKRENLRSSGETQEPYWPVAVPSKMGFSLPTEIPRMLAGKLSLSCTPSRLKFLDASVLEKKYSLIVG